MFIRNTSSSDAYKIDISNTETVAALKSLITEETGIPSKFQILSFNDATLENDQLLSTYGLTESSKVSLSMHMNGGCGAGCNICGAGGGCHCIVM